VLLRHAGIVAASLLLSFSVRAADPQRPVRFDYEAEPTCPEPEAWVSSVLSRAPAARPAVADEPAWTLRARIVREGGRFAGRLQVVTPGSVSDTRRFRGSSCEQVALALAIAAALSVDPEHGGAAPNESSDVSAAPVEQPPAAPSPTASAPPPPAAPATVRNAENVVPARADDSVGPRAHWTLGFGASGLVTHAVIDSTMWGGELVALLRPEPGPPVVLRWSAGYAGSPTIDAPPGQARFYFPNLALEGCVLGLGATAWSIGLCGGARGAALVATGLGVNRPSSATRGWLSWMGGLRGEVGPAHGFRAEIGASLVVRQTRYTYTFDRPPVTITDPPLLGWELTLGVMLPR
jgi:hypothetical protein